jgi:hypothetical protein
MSVNEKSSTHPSNDQPTTDLVQLTKAIAFFLNEGESTVKWTFKPLDEPYPTQYIKGPNEVVNAHVPTERDRTTASFYHNDKAYGDIQVSGDSVSLKLSSLTMQQAKRILAMLAEVR